MPNLRIRKDFPIYGSYPDLVYLDSSSTTLVPKSVITASSEFLRNIAVSSRKGAHDLAVKGGQIVEDTRNKLANKLGTKKNEISFQGNLPSAITSFVLGFDWNSEKKESIIVSESEHNSVSIPLRRISNIINLDVHILKTDENGIINLQELENLINDQTGIVAVSEYAFGVDKRNPMESIYDVVCQFDAILLTEVSREVAFSENIGFSSYSDIAFLSANRAFMAPPETIIQWVSSDLSSKINPGILGGSSVSIVDKASFETALSPDKFESGILPISNIAAINKAIDYTSNLIKKGLKKHIHTLAKRLLESLQDIPSLKVYGNPTADNSSLLFTLGADSAVSCHDIALFLNQNNIAVRSGLLCAPLLAKKYSDSGVIQVSLHGYNNLADIDEFSEQLRKISSQLI